MNSAPSDSNAPPGEVFGSVTPRLWTPPLRELTPETTTGFDEIAFARDVVGIPLDPWEEWLSIHAGELLPDGRPRFRTVLALVARQNGKSTWARVKILYWMFFDLPGVPDAFIIGTSTDRSYAKKFWRKTAELIQRNPYLRDELEGIRLTISEECIVTIGGVEFGFAANNAAAGRSRTVNRALIDEVREHRSLDAWGAITGAMNAVPDGQVVCISNQGDDSAVLLDTLRDPALEYIETGEGDPRLGLFEWSAPPGADPTDEEALAQANPNYGHRVDRDALLGAARRARKAGGLELASFRTEVLCQRVSLLDPAIDPDAWEAAGTSTPVDLAEHRDRVVLALDVSIDGQHATLVAAAVVDGVVHLDVVAAWSGPKATQELRRDLPGIVGKVKPRVVGWLPLGPAAAIAADMTEKPRAGWPPRRVTLETITADTASVCMALPLLVTGGEIRHPRDPLLDSHVASAQKLRTGDRWVYTRRGAGAVDAVYAAAAATHLARVLPPPPPKLVAL
jgi:hypothetical protein